MLPVRFKGRPPFTDAKPVSRTTLVNKIQEEQSASARQPLACAHLFSKAVQDSLASAGGDLRKAMHNRLVIMRSQR